MVGNTFILMEIARFKTNDLMNEAAQDRLATLASGGVDRPRGVGTLTRVLRGWSPARSNDGFSPNGLTGEGHRR